MAKDIFEIVAKDRDKTNITFSDDMGMTFEEVMLKYNKKEVRE